MTLTSTAMRRLVREITQLTTSPPEGIRIITNEEDILDFTGVILGPEQTPYEGGYFKVKFHFTEEFPNAPPKCLFATKIFHPNVSKSGDICVSTLKKDWKREYGILHILVTIRCLLIYPNAESALDEAAGKLLLEDWDGYARHAKMITAVHATPKVRPVEFDIPDAVQKPSVSASSLGKTSGGPSAHDAVVIKSLTISSIPGPTPHSIPFAPTSIIEPLVVPEPAPLSTPIISASPPHSTARPNKASSSMLPSSSSTSSTASSSSMYGFGLYEPTPEPLQLSPSNTNSHLPAVSAPPVVIPQSTSSTGSSLQPKEGAAGPTVQREMGGPLRPSTSNGNNSSGTTKTGLMKRPATGGVEKRKKGLKRL